MRIFAAAVLICVVTFLAGVAGDLSLAAQAPRQLVSETVYVNHGPVARVRIPPPIVLASAVEPAAPAQVRVRLRPIETPRIYQAALILEPKAPIPAKAPAKPVVLAEGPAKAAA